MYNIIKQLSVFLYQTQQAVFFPSPDTKIVRNDYEQKIQIVHRSGCG